MKTNKNVIGIAAIILFFTSCVSVQQIGQLTMISNRNIDKSQNYELIKSYVGSSDDERKHSKATTIQQAIDGTVQEVPGGEYIMNVRIYLVMHGSKHQYFSVEGDVWGIKQNSTEPSPDGSTYYSFKEGDNVAWRYDSKYYTGIIVSMKDRKKCLVKVDDNGKTIAIVANTQPQQGNTQSTTQLSVEIKIGDRVTWQDKNDKKFYPGLVVGQGNGTWLIKDDDDGKTYPVDASQVYLSK